MEVVRRGLHEARVAPEGAAAARPATGLVHVRVEDRRVPVDVRRAGVLPDDRVPDLRSAGHDEDAGAGGTCRALVAGHGVVDQARDVSGDPDAGPHAEGGPVDVAQLVLDHHVAVELRDLPEVLCMDTRSGEAGPVLEQCVALDLRLRIDDRDPAPDEGLLGEEVVGAVLGDVVVADGDPLSDRPEGHAALAHEDAGPGGVGSVEGQLATADSGRAVPPVRAVDHGHAAAVGLVPAGGNALRDDRVHHQGRCVLHVDPTAVGVLGRAVRVVDPEAGAAIELAVPDGPVRGEHGCHPTTVDQGVAPREEIALHGRRGAVHHRDTAAVAFGIIEVERGVARGRDRGRGADTQDRTAELPRVVVRELVVRQGDRKAAGVDDGDRSAPRRRARVAVQGPTLAHVIASELIGLDARNVDPYQRHAAPLVLGPVAADQVALELEEAACPRGAARGEHPAAACGGDVAEDLVLEEQGPGGEGVHARAGCDAIRTVLSDRVSLDGGCRTVAQDGRGVDGAGESKATQDGSASLAAGEANDRQGEARR